MGSNAWKAVAGCIVGVLAIILMIMFASGSIEIGGFLDRKVENERHKTYKTSTAFRDGLESELSDLYRQYRTTKDDGAKDGIAFKVRFETGKIDINKLQNKELIPFIKECRDR